MSRRLVAFVVAAAAAGCSSTGLDPFPEAGEPGAGGPWNTGLDPFPPPGRASTASFGLNPFPKNVNTGSDRRVGLHPFPHSGKEKAAAAAPVGSAPVTSSAKPANTGAAAVAAPAPAPVAAPAAGPPGTRLQLKFEKGATSRYRMATDTLMKSPMFGEDGMKMKMGMDMKQEVRDARADGTADVRSTFESMSMEMNNPFTGEFKIDTRDPESVKKAKENPMLGQMADMFTGIVGKSVEMTLDRTGKTVAAGNMEEVFGQLSGAMGSSPAGQMTGMPSPFPETPVFEGLSWPMKSEQESPMGTMATDGKMTVKSYDPATGLVSIDMEGTITHKPKEAAAGAEDDMQAQMAAMIKIKDAKMKGRIVFDAKKGRLVSSVTDISMTMENPMMGGEMQLESKADLSLLE